MDGVGRERVLLYDGVGQAWFSAAAVADYLGQRLPLLEVELRPDLLRHALGARSACKYARPTGAAPDEALGGLAEELCLARVRDPRRQVAAQRRQVLKPELDYELRLLAGLSRPAAGVTYDGLELQRIAFNVLPEAERNIGALHLWFTERLVATWDDSDRRYHARTSVYGFPAIVSTSGLVEAPARDRAHYLARRLGLPETEGNGYLGYEDPRTTEVAKGYAMQAVFYAATGEPFCSDPHCRLYNAHWQSELLAAQLDGGDLCQHHREALSSLEL